MTDGDVESHLVMAKSKVAPKNVATLPRKELAAALAATRLLVHVCEALKMNPKEARCFTDSMTTLQWLKKHPRTWKQWVANRVASIHELTGSRAMAPRGWPRQPSGLAQQRHHGGRAGRQRSGITAQRGYCCRKRSGLAHVLSTRWIT
jgi:hypothetical protein